MEQFIGKNRIWDNPEFIKAKDIMITEPVKSNKERTIIQGIEIMKNNKVDSLLIVDTETKLIGLVTSKTIRKEDDKTKKLLNIMETDFRKVNEEDSLIDIIKEMVENHIRYIPVVNDENKLTGLITKSTLLEVLSNKYMEGVDFNE